MDHDISLADLVLFHNFRSHPGCRFSFLLVSVLVVRPVKAFLNTLDGALRLS